MRTNLAHIAAAAFNRPVLLEPGYARLFYATLAARYGVDAVINVAGEAEAVADLQREGAGVRRAGGQDRRSYQVIDGVAVLPISGTLTHKYGYVNPASGMTGYDGIQYRLGEAMADPEVRGLLLDFDTPGGTVAGAFDTADLIQRYGQHKPIWSLGYDMNASAGQLLAAAGSRRLITQTGQAGSIGVLVAHTNVEQMLAEQGAEITLIYAGAHKVDGNPYTALPDDVRARIQAEVDDTRQRFAAKVAGFTGMSLEAVLATEAQLYEGQAAVDVGLADEVVNGADAVGLMSEFLKGQGQQHYTRGATAMSKPETASADTTAPATATPAPAQPSAEQLQNAAQQAATAERERVLGILGCEEAKGREELAQKLVAKGMSLEDAQEVLAVAPLAAVERSGQTALDQLAGEHGDSLEVGDNDESDKTAGLAAAVNAVSARG